ncbi:MAG: hypothetical protein AAF153_02380, partial [Pseudomonadota bacterium]
MAETQVNILPIKVDSSALMAVAPSKAKANIKVSGNKFNQMLQQTKVKSKTDISNKNNYHNKFTNKSNHDLKHNASRQTTSTKTANNKDSKTRDIDNNAKDDSNIFVQNPELTAAIAQELVDKKLSLEERFGIEIDKTNEAANFGLSVVQQHQQVQQALQDLSQTIVNNNIVLNEVSTEVKTAFADAQIAALDGEQVALAQFEKQSLNTQLLSPNNNQTQFNQAPAVSNILQEFFNTSQTFDNNDQVHQLAELALQYAENGLSDEQHQVLTELITDDDQREQLLAKINNLSNSNNKVTSAEAPSFDNLVTTDIADLVTDLTTLVSNNTNLTNTFELESNNITTTLGDAAR